MYKRQDLLAAISPDEADETKNLLINNLSLKYQKFLREFQETGFFSVMDNHYDELRKAYGDTLERYLKASANSTIGSLLLKAFMVVSLKTRQDINSWVWQEYLEAAVVTPLHPSVLEMIRHQHAYLCESFCYYAKRALEESGSGAFSLKRWDRVADHSKIQ